MAPSSLQLQVPSALNERDVIFNRVEWNMRLDNTLFEILGVLIVVAF